MSAKSFADHPELEISEAAYPIRDRDDLDGLAQLACLGQPDTAKAVRCFRRLLGLKRKRTHQTGEQ